MSRTTASCRKLGDLDPSVLTQYVCMSVLFIFNTEDIGLTRLAGMTYKRAYRDTASTARRSLEGVMETPGREPGPCFFTLWNPPCPLRCCLVTPPAPPIRLFSTALNSIGWNWAS